jgi:CO/xanthine dehydrogenase Mo-binding subunit
VIDVTHLSENRFVMDSTATDVFVARADAPCKYSVPANEAGFGEGTRPEELGVETVASNPLLPTDRKWGIRFNVDGTVTVVLGMKDYGRGWFSTYFASLVAARLGVPVKRVRLYYNATFPAVLQTPVLSPNVFHRCHMSPLVNAVADVIEHMCDQVIEKGRSIFAMLAGLYVSDIGFDRQSGRFFVLQKSRNCTVLELAGATRRGVSMSMEVAGKLRQESVKALPEGSLMPSAA